MLSDEDFRNLRSRWEGARAELARLVPIYSNRSDDEAGVAATLLKDTRPKVRPNPTPTPNPKPKPNPNPHPNPNPNFNQIHNEVGLKHQSIYAAWTFVAGPLLS